MRILAMVPWKWGAKPRWDTRKRRFSVLSGIISLAPSEIRPTLLRSNYLVRPRSTVDAKNVTLNDLERPFYVNSMFVKLKFKSYLFADADSAMLIPVDE